MTTKKPKAKSSRGILKVPCIPLNKILSIKRLTDKSLEKIINILKDLVSASKEDKFDIKQYVSAVVLSLLPDEEKVKLIASVKDAEPQAGAMIMAAIYNSIVDHYPSLRIEYVCSDINGFIPQSVGEELGLQHDPEFDAMLDKETESKKSKATKSKKYEFNTLEDIEILRESLRSLIKGQDGAIESVCNAIKLKAVGFTKMLSLFFIGPTGVGKTELSKLLGDKYSGNYYKINCAEFALGHEQNKLIGAPPGYIGHNDKSVLKEKADKSNKWVFVFDEIEKAHDKFFNFLLSLMDTGKVTDNMGVNLDFTDSIFIFTSNCGVKDLKLETTNFTKAISPQGNKETLMESIKDTFSPEFRNRIDEFVFFNPITVDIAEQIVQLRLKELPIKRTPELIKHCVENGFSEEFGARELARYIKRTVALPLADAILATKVPQDITYLYDVAVINNKVSIINTVSR